MALEMRCKLDEWNGGLTDYSRMDYGELSWRAVASFSKTRFWA